MTLEQLIATVFGWIAVCGTILAVTYMVQYGPQPQFRLVPTCVERAK